MSELTQIVKGTSATVTVTYEVNGVGQNLDTGVPVVTLTKPDGTAGPASGTVTSLGSGAYSFVVAAQAEVIWLDYTAVGTIGGQPQTLTGRIEWVGEALFNISAFRALRVANGSPDGGPPAILGSTKISTDTTSGSSGARPQKIARTPPARSPRSAESPGEVSRCAIGSASEKPLLSPWPTRSRSMMLSRSRELAAICPAISLRSLEFFAET